MMTKRVWTSFVSFFAVGASVLACSAAPEGESATSLGQAGTVSRGTNLFACGTSACDAETHYCEHVIGGRPGASFYQCAVVPEACASNVTCGCVASRFEMCTGSNGELTVTIDAP